MTTDRSMLPNLFDVLSRRHSAADVAEAVYAAEGEIRALHDIDLSDLRDDSDWPRPDVPPPVGRRNRTDLPAGDADNIDWRSVALRLAERGDWGGLSTRETNTLQDMLLDAADRGPA